MIVPCPRKDGDNQCGFQEIIINGDFLATPFDSSIDVQFLLIRKRSFRLTVLENLEIPKVL